MIVKKKYLLWITAIVMALTMSLCGCGSQADTGAPEDAVIADGLAKIKVEGETDLPGNFFLSFVYSRNHAERP